MKKVYTALFLTVLFIAASMLIIRYFLDHEAPWYRHYSTFQSFPDGIKGSQDDLTTDEQRLLAAAQRANQDVRFCFADLTADGQNELLTFKWDDQAHTIAKLEVTALAPSGELQSLWQRRIRIFGNTDSRMALYLCPEADGSFSLLLDRSMRMERLMGYERFQFRWQDGRYEPQYLASEKIRSLESLSEFSTLQQWMKTAVMIVDSYPQNKVK